MAINSHDTQIPAAVGIVSSPDPPFNTARGKGGLVNIVHFCRSTEFWGQSDWLMWAIISPVLGSLLKPLSFTHHTLQTSLAHLQFTDFKGLAFSEIHSNY